MYQHACDHRGHEPERFDGADAEPRECWPGAVPSNSPPNAEDRSAYEQTCVDVTQGGKMKSVGEYRAATTEHEAEQQHGREHRSAEYKQQRWIEVPEQIEKPEYASWICHARHGQPNPEQRTGGERGE